MIVTPVPAAARSAISAFGVLQDVRVEGAAQAAVRGHDHELDVADRLARLEQRMLGVLLRPGHLGERGAHPLRVGARGLDRVLGAAQLRAGHHAHGAGDLLRLLDAVMRRWMSFRFGTSGGFARGGGLEGWKISANASSAAISFCSTSSSSFPDCRGWRSRMSPWLLRMYSSISCS